MNDINDQSIISNNLNLSQTHKTKLFDNITEEIGYGIEQWKSIFLCGLIYMLCEFYRTLNSCMYFAIKSFYNSSDDDIALSNSFVYVAGIGSSFIMGYLTAYVFL